MTSAISHRTDRTQITLTPVETAAQGTIPQFLEFHRLVERGVSPALAASQLGVDPLLGHLWLCLPADHFSAVEAESPVDPPPTLVRLGPPVVGVSRTLLVRVPAGGSLESPAVTDGLKRSATSEAALSNAAHAAKRGGYVGRTRAYVLPGALAQTLTAGAEATGVDVALLAGQLLATEWDLRVEWPPRGVNRKPAAPRRPPLPRRVLLTRQYANVAERLLAQRELAALDASTVTGEKLAARRIELGLSQRALAAAAGLSRGLLAETERARRRNVQTRIRIADALTRLEGERLLRDAEALVRRVRHEPHEPEEAPQS